MINETKSYLRKYFQKRRSKHGPMVVYRQNLTGDDGRPVINKSMALAMSTPVYHRFRLAQLMGQALEDKTYKKTLRGLDTWYEVQDVYEHFLDTMKDAVYLSSLSVAVFKEKSSCYRLTIPKLHHLQERPYLPDYEYYYILGCY